MILNQMNYLKSIKIEVLTPEILNEFIEKKYLWMYNEASDSWDIKIIWNIDKKEGIE